MEFMKKLILLSLTFLVACEFNNEKTIGPEAQETSPDAQAVVDAAKKLVELQRKLQPNSWDVSLEESLMKENPLTPPFFTPKSGIPPNLSDTSYWDAGLWNCRKLKLGMPLCDIDSSEHMIAQHFAEGANSDVTGQVAVLAPGEHTLVSSCMESGGIKISIGTRRSSDLFKGDELVVGFDNEQSVKYKFNSINSNLVAIKDAKQLLENLMADFTSIEIRSSSENNESSDNARFIVKNFAKAWAVACGWHLEYDAKTGIKK